MHAVPEEPGKLPFGSVEHTVAIGAPPKLIEIVRFGAKLLPETSTVLPAGPTVGSRPALATIVVVPFARSRPSVAWTVHVPARSGGIWMEHGVPVSPGKVPVGSVEQLEATPKPPNVNEIAELAANPVPEVWTVDPTPPIVGASEIVGSTVNTLVTGRPAVPGIMLRLPEFAFDTKTWPVPLSNARASGSLPTARVATTALVVSEMALTVSEAEFP